MRKFKETKIGKFLKETKAGKAITSAALGAIKGVQVIGNIATELKDNYADDLTGTGKRNYTRLAAYVLVGALMLGRIFKPEVVNAELIGKIMEFATELSE